MSRLPNDRPLWTTGISVADSEDVHIRGYSLRQLMADFDFDFVSGVFLIFLGELPSTSQRKVLDTMLLAAIDHGISPSATVTRFVAGAGSPIQASVASGLLTFGDIHAGAGEEFCRLLAQAVGNSEGSIQQTAEAFVQRMKSQGRRVPGYGHPQHPSGDPRTPILLNVAYDAGISDRHIEMAIAIEDAIEAQSGRRIPMNIDGALGSLMMDLGFSWRHARPLAMISRIVGLSAHAVEEYERGRGWPALPDELLAYDGPEFRDLPDRGSQ